MWKSSVVSGRAVKVMFPPRRIIGWKWCREIVKGVFDLKPALVYSWKGFCENRQRFPGESLQEKSRKSGRGGRMRRSITDELQSGSGCCLEGFSCFFFYFYFRICSSLSNLTMCLVMFQTFWIWFFVLKIKIVIWKHLYENIIILI